MVWLVIFRKGRIGAALVFASRRISRQLSRRPTQLCILRNLLGRCVPPLPRFAVFPSVYSVLSLCKTNSQKYLKAFRFPNLLKTGFLEIPQWFEPMTDLIRLPAFPDKRHRDIMIQLWQHFNQSNQSLITSSTPRFLLSPTEPKILTRTTSYIDFSFLEIIISNTPNLFYSSEYFRRFPPKKLLPADCGSASFLPPRIIFRGISLFNSHFVSFTIVSFPCVHHRSLGPVFPRHPLPPLRGPSTWVCHVEGWGMLDFFPLQFAHNLIHSNLSFYLLFLGLFFNIFYSFIYIPIA